jgi:hypothetical protein
VKQPFTFNQMYSMIPSHKISAVFKCLWEFVTGEMEWGVNREGEREREREQQINSVRDGGLDRNGSGVGQKWPKEKLNT